jgi:hypothetical protein
MLLAQVYVAREERFETWFTGNIRGVDDHDGVPIWSANLRPPRPDSASD